MRKLIILLITSVILYGCSKKETSKPSIPYDPCFDFINNGFGSLHELITYNEAKSFFDSTDGSLLDSQRIDTNLWETYQWRCGQYAATMKFRNDTLVYAEKNCYDIKVSKAVPITWPATTAPMGYFDLKNQFGVAGDFYYFDCSTAIEKYGFHWYSDTPSCIVETIQFIHDTDFNGNSSLSTYK